MQPWIRRLLSPAKDWLSATQRINSSLSRLLRDSGFFFGGPLNTTHVKEQQKSKSYEDLCLPEERDVLIETFPSLLEVEQILEYNFRNPDLLEEAFTHNSYHDKCFSYERLEYVGDSVLSLLITKQQFSLYPNLPPGLLSPLRAANVDTEKLARAAVFHKLHRYIRHRNPRLKKQIQHFVGALPKYPLHSNGLIDAPKVLADVLESTIGAVFIDSNSSIDTTWKVAKGIIQPIITPNMLQIHPVKKLYETCQKNGLKVRMVDLWLKEGAYEIIVDNRLRGRGICRAKKGIALNRAAEDAYKEIVEKLGLKHDIDSFS